MATFDENGKYIKTNWRTGDKITAEKLNKIEDSLEEINNNDISRYLEADSRLDVVESKLGLANNDIVNRIDALEDTLRTESDAIKLEQYRIEAECEASDTVLTNRVNNLESDLQAQMDQGNTDMKAMNSRIEHISRNHIYISEFNDDLQAAVNYCRDNNCDLIINKDLEIFNTIMVNNNFIGNRAGGIRIIGTPNRPTITLNSSSDIPAFYFYGGSGAFSNTGLENLTIATTVQNVNTAVKVNGVCRGDFHNLSISNFKYGIHVCNDTGAGTFTELNSFTDIVLNYNTNGIRMERLAGDASFHGNNFFNVYINVGANQIGFNFVSGYYYNGNFRLYMWAHDTSAVYLNADGTAETNIGDITYESFKVGKFTGNGRFWFSGAIRGIGGCNTSEIATRSNGEHVIHCDTFMRNISHSTVGVIHSLWSGSHYTGINPGIYGVEKDNEKSFLINGYAYGTLSKLYLGVTDINNDLDKMQPGLHISLKGNSMKTYSSDGLSIYDSDGKLCGKFDNGRIYGNSGAIVDTTITANAGVAQQVVIPNSYQDSSIISLASLKIKGTNYEITRLYSVNHQGYGGAGSCTLLANHYSLSRDGVVLNSVSVNSDGQLVLDITTSIDLRVIARFQGVGIMY